MSPASFPDNFVSHVFVQLVDLKQLEFFSTNQPTDQTNLLIEAPFRSLKKGHGRPNKQKAEQTLLVTESVLE